MPICLVFDHQPYCTIAHHKHLSRLNSMSHDPLFLTSGLLGGFGHLTTRFIGLDHGLDNTDGNGLDVHVSGRIIRESE